MDINSSPKAKRTINVSEETERFFKKMELDGGDPASFGGALMEMAVQMLRHGHIAWTGQGFECETKRGTVSLKLNMPVSKASGNKDNAAKAKAAYEKFKQQSKNKQQ